MTLDRLIGARTVEMLQKEAIRQNDSALLPHFIVYAAGSRVLAGAVGESCQESKTAEGGKEESAALR